MASSWLTNGGDPNRLLNGMILQVGHLNSYEKEEWSLLSNAVSKCRGLPAKTVQAQPDTRREGFDEFFDRMYIYIYEFIYIYRVLNAVYICNLGCFS